METATAGLLGGQCYRCGYDLRGIGDDRPCPECGLLAERSRRVTDELHDTRPSSILFAAVWPVTFSLLVDRIAAWQMNSFYWLVRILFGGFEIAAVIFLIGVLLLTRREGYEPADRADRRLRIWLRIAALVPVVGVLLEAVYVEVQFRQMMMNVTDAPLGWQGFVLLMIGIAPLPWLVFLRLRGLAKRARSAHLAEHCLIVGIGSSAAVLCAGNGLGMIGR